VSKRWGFIDFLIVAYAATENVVAFIGAKGLEVLKIMNPLLHGDKTRPP
jgi:hypothetical protein